MCFFCRCYNEAARNPLSVIQQEAFIFNSSIEKNVTMFGDFVPGQVEAAIEGAGWTLSAARTDTTKIVVTHVLNEAVLRRFDAVAVLIGGRLRELGSFEELLEARGFLYSMLTLSAAAED